MTSADTLACYRVHRDSKGEIQAACMDCVPNDLPEGNVRVQVQWSALNYKDALAATGHPGVVRSFPHVPGIDAAGVVIESQDPRWNPGAEVVVTGCDLGSRYLGRVGTANPCSWRLVNCPPAGHYLCEIA